VTKARNLAEANRTVVMIGAIVSGPLIVLFAFGLSWLLRTPFPGSFAWTVEGALAGVAATAPLLLLLRWYMKTRSAYVTRHREKQIEEFSRASFLFAPLISLWIALGAGVSEEILFRGVIQDYAATKLPMAAAIILPNILFGLLHARSVLYALIAGVIGCWLGVVYWATDNLLAPIVAHALYDVFALAALRRSFNAQPRVDAASGSSVTG
jgi:hypothetical protein